MSDERLKALLEAALTRRDQALDELDRAHLEFLRARKDVQRLATTLADPAMLDDVIDPRD